MIRLPRAPKLAIAASLALLIAACGGQATRPAEPEPQPAAQLAEIEAMLAEGRALAAVRIYTDMARAAREPASRQDHLLSAIEVLFDHGYPELGADRLKALPAQLETPQLEKRRQIASAQFAVAQFQPQSALMLLDASKPLNDIVLQRREMETRAQALQQLGDFTGEFRARLELDELLDPESPQLERNRQAIWYLLDGLEDAQLAQVSVAGVDSIYRGWVELAYTLRDARRRGGNLAELVQRWREQFPGHPADGAFTDTLVADALLDSGRSSQIALLLPLSGPLANPAAAVRDGFLAAWYSDQREGLKPDIRIYDTGDGSESVWAVYSRALNDGAGTIVGPLRKEAVEELATSSSLPLKTLALNYVENSWQVAPPEMTQFGLLPEDEARTVAEYVTQNSLRRAVAMVPAGAWGDRVAKAFGEELRAQGGQLLGVQSYQEDAHDFSDPIRNLLHLTESRQRNALLERLLGQNLEFEPRRRQDVDLIFLAAAPRQGRLIKPQFKFHHAGDIPVFSTSRIYTGQPSERDDRDLDGLRFADIPWLLQDREETGLAGQVEQLWPQANGGLARLYALGADAYALTPWLDELRRDPGLRLNGQTGQLSMDESGRIHRKLSWARFEQGLPQTLLREQP
jgi:hypothetical protein